MRKRQMLWSGTLLAILVVAGLSPVHAATIIGRWELDHGYADSSGNQYHFAQVGTVALVPGVSGDAADFDGGTTTYPSSPDALDSAGSPGGYPDISGFNAAGFSIMAWINPDGLGAYAPILNQDKSIPSDEHFGYSLLLDGGRKLKLMLRDSGDDRLLAMTQEPVVFDAWTHIAATWDGSLTDGISLYLDGAPVPIIIDTAGGVFDGLADSVSIRAGAEHGNSANTVIGFDGQMDHLSLWSGVLTAGEIAADYNYTIPEPSALIIWSLLATLGLSIGWRRRKSRPVT